MSFNMDVKYLFLLINIVNFHVVIGIN
jgi:hypothetical protein